MPRVGCTAERLLVAWMVLVLATTSRLTAAQASSSGSKQPSRRLLQDTAGAPVGVPGPDNTIVYTFTGPDGQPVLVSLPAGPPAASPEPSPAPSPLPSPPLSPLPSPQNTASPAAVAAPPLSAQNPPVTPGANVTAGANTTSNATVAQGVQVDVTLDLKAPGLRIPQSFLGLSEEWGAIELFGATKEYIKILKDLTQYGTGPLILRVGGGSTDLREYVASPAIYDAMAQLNRDTGAKFILGLNFESYDLDLARAQLQAGRDRMPQGSVITYEIGNEPNYYKGKNGTTNGDDYIKCCFVFDWRDFSRALSCPKGPSSCVNNQFAGPVWGHIFMFPRAMDWFIRESRPSLQETSVHWYTATSSKAGSAADLLKEGPTRTAIDNLKQLIAVARNYSLDLRVGEANTISDSGRVGVSDTFAAALWSLDSSFEAAAAGAIGMNFHQGNGGSIYAAVLRPTGADGKLQPPIVRPQWYGFLMFQMAANRGSRFVGKQIKSSTDMVKVWPLSDLIDDTLRVIIINKTPDTPASVTITVPSSRYGTATLVRLQAQGGLAAKNGVSLGGRSYISGSANEGGSRVQESVIRKLSKVEGSLIYTVSMPAGTAALLTIPKAS